MNNVNTEITGKMRSIVDNIIRNEGREDEIGTPTFRRSMEVILFDYELMREKFETAGIDMTNWKDNYKNVLENLKI